MSKSYYFLAAIMSLFVTTAAVSLTSLAATDTAKIGFRPDGQHRQETRQAIDDSDYETWSATMKEQVANLRTRADELEGKINQATFDKLVEAHRLMSEGDREGAQTIMNEIGLMGPMGPGGHFNGPDGDFSGAGRAFKNKN
ncbi:MAG: hypothetical protein RB292_04745 [Patescibacteria group bacterium]|jgi:hypothetical protein|nr:hypothetical protein [Patescibacteria group bacterium]